MNRHPEKAEISWEHIEIMAALKSAKVVLHHAMYRWRHSFFVVELLSLLTTMYIQENIKETNKRRRETKFLVSFSFLS
jgi:hypothetical protein